MRVLLLCSLGGDVDERLGDEVAAVGLEDVSAWPQMTLNGGTWYLRARPNGPVHLLLKRFMRRAMRVLRAYPERKWYDEEKRKRLGKNKPADFLLFDQTVFNVVLLETLIGRPIELNSSAMVQPIGDRSPEFSAVKWTLSCCHAAPWSMVKG